MISVETKSASACHSRTRGCRILLPLALWLTIHAQAQPSNSTGRVVGRNGYCEELTDSASAVQAPALRADFLLKTLDLCPSTSPPRRKAILETVLRTADQVEQLFPTEPVPVGFTDTEPALAAIASDLGVDRLSLKLRSISALSDVDPRTARTWFETLAPTQPVPLTCEDFQVPRLRQYYQVLGDLTDRSFSTEESQRGQRDAFLTSHLFPASAPAHVLGILYFLSEAKLPGKTLENLLAVLTSQLHDIQADDRSFSVHLLSEGGQNRLRVLVSRCQAEGIAVAAFLSAFREYYARHLKQPRCADMVRSKPLQEREASALQQVDLMAGAHLNEARLDLKSIVSAKLVESRPPLDLVADTPEYREWFQTLIDRKKGTPGSEAPASVFDRVLREVEDWKKSRKLSARQFFQIKALVLARVMQQASGADETKKAASVYAEFFGRAEEIRQHFAAEWLYSAKSFLSLCRRTGDLREQLYQIVENNRDITLSTYARLDRAMQKGPRSGY